MRLLVVDDDPAVCEVVQSHAAHEGWTVVTAGTAAEGLAAFAALTPDMVVLDLMLPDCRGLDALAAIRRRSDAYVILLTARAAEDERIAGLVHGADDYVVKPFSPGELFARLKALLRRPRGPAAAAPDADAGEVVETADLAIDLGRHEVRRSGVRIDLTAAEFRLLETLARHPGRVFTRGQLVDAVWQATFVGGERVVDVHIGHVRRKLGDGAERQTLIETVRGVGYRLRADDLR